jgi:hypothetical protein
MSGKGISLQEKRGREIKFARVIKERNKTGME